MDKGARKELHELQSFWTAVRFLREQAPDIPAFDPANENAVEEWKAASQKREGYRLALSHLGVSLDEQ